MKARILLLLVIICSQFSLFAQRTIPPTDAFQVLGAVENPTTFTMAAFDSFPATKLPNLVVYNHKGEIKDTLTGLAGVPLQRVLASIQFKYEKPRDLNEFYFVMTASDGYKVVCSWNELYNTEAGKHFYIITEMEGKKLRALDQRMIFLAAGDLKTGRRYIKGLEKIEVRRVQ
ncbi:MAG TPA: hypothetical protein VLC98_00375 [Phnomibacter sp.]|nr:hypothetical protein [Phnomibacter sp.]